MEVKRKISYNYEKSFERIDEILNTTNTFDEKDVIPSREDLTYNNGFYVKCYAIFVDVRDSSSLPNRYRRPTLAKIYRSYISELVAILNNYETCKEINIVGDCVSGIFEASQKKDVLDVFQAGYTINSLVKTLNYKMSKKGWDEIKIGIGISKGRALMIQAGFKGSGINDVVWMGDVVNDASNLCSEGNKGFIDSMVISNDVYDDLSGYKNQYDKKYQDLFTRQWEGKFYYGNIIRLDMDDWLDKEKKKNS